MTLINPADIQRHIEFKQAINDLSENGHIRHYSAEISEKTGEDRSNIVKYFKGTKPIGDNFWKKFNKAYSRALKRVHEIDTPKREKKIPSTDTATVYSITTPSRSVLESVSNKEEKKKLINHEKRIAKLEQQVADLQKQLDEYHRANDRKE